MQFAMEIRQRSRLGDRTWRYAHRPLEYLPHLPIEPRDPSDEERFRQRLERGAKASADGDLDGRLDIVVRAKANSLPDRHGRPAELEVVRPLELGHDRLDAPDPGVVRLANGPQEPPDWRREPVAGCSCVDCKELSRFLDDPRTPALRLPLVERRRRHLHEIIDREQLDTTHVTERRGRPYTLVCTKTEASYERAAQAHRVDLEHLARMRELSDWHDRLSAAPGRGAKVPTSEKATRKRTTNGANRK